MLVTTTGQSRFFRGEDNVTTSTSSLVTAVYPHIHGGVRIYTLGNTSGDGCPILGFCGSRVPKIGDSLPRTPLKPPCKI